MKPSQTDRKVNETDRTEQKTNRRTFLRATGAGVAGVGLLGTAGTAAAATNFTFIDSASYGSSTGDVAEIQLMCHSNGRPAQETHDHAETTFSDLWGGISNLDGIYLTTYEHDAEMGYDADLDFLDNLISDHWTDGNDRIKVWDVEEGGWGWSSSAEDREAIINIADPAMTSSSIYPAITGFPGDDGQGHNNMHARCRVSSAVYGRLTKAAIMSLCRIHDKGEWNDSSSNLPKQSSVNEFVDIGWAEVTGTNWAGTDILEPTALGYFTTPDYSCNNGPCQRTEPSDWTTGSEYIQKVTPCASYQVDLAADYF